MVLTVRDNDEPFNNYSLRDTSGITLKYTFRQQATPSCTTPNCTAPRARDVCSQRRKNYDPSPSVQKNVRDDAKPSLFYSLANYVPFNFKLHYASTSPK